ncbi:nuclear transport factor 2 family protein [Phormidium tenue FACHB-886]|nr:nuclear transport factor 2 family protein [Phormidium tenue FACHB-886]
MSHKKQYLSLSRRVFTGGIAGFAAIATAYLGRASAQSTPPTAAATVNDSRWQYFLDRAEIIDAVNAVGFFADRQDWAVVRRQFAEEVDMDYTSLAGGEPVRVKADDLIRGWEQGLSALPATQHMITNHQVTVEGDEAQCLSSFRAWHYSPNDEGSPLWHLYGYYTHRFQRTAEGWKIISMTLTKTAAEGNFALSGLASRAGVTHTEQ